MREKQRFNLKALNRLPQLQQQQQQQLSNNRYYHYEHEDVLYKIIPLIINVQIVHVKLKLVKKVV